VIPEIGANGFVEELESSVQFRYGPCYATLAESMGIGQPYAFRQAGLVMGIILLVSLTITVCFRH
jgi:hypothetical protein